MHCSGLPCLLFKLCFLLIYCSRWQVQNAPGTVHPPIIGCMLCENLEHLCWKAGKHTSLTLELQCLSSRKKGSLNMCSTHLPVARGEVQPIAGCCLPCSGYSLQVLQVPACSAPWLDTWWSHFPSLWLGESLKTEEKKIEELSKKAYCWFTRDYQACSQYCFWYLLLAFWDNWFMD